MPFFGDERIDVDAFDKSARADLVKLNEQVEASDHNSSWVEAQSLFDEASHQFSLAMIHLNNMVVDKRIERRTAFEAMGVVMGGMMGNILPGLSSEHDLGAYKAGYARSVKATTTKDIRDPNVASVDTMFNKQGTH